MTIVQADLVDVNDGELYYEVHGEGPAVVLVHGFGVDRRMWAGQIDALSDHYMVVTYDLRGFGKSSVPSATYRHYVDLAAVLDYLGIDKTSLIGSSLGGRISLDFAIAYQKRTTSVITAAGIPSGFQFNRPPGTPPGPNRALFRATLERLSDKNADSLKGMVDAYSRWHLKNQDPREEVNPPAVTRLGEVMAPTLVTVGSVDDLDFHRAAEMLMMGVAHPRKHIFEGSGHLPNMDAPEEFNQVALEFLDDNMQPSVIL